MLYKCIQALNEGNWKTVPFTSPLPSRGFAATCLPLCIVATFGVLCTYSSRAWWRSFEPVCRHIRRATRCEHSTMGWPLPMCSRRHFSRVRSDIERWMIVDIDSSYFPVNRTLRRIAPRPRTMSQVLQISKRNLAKQIKSRIRMPSDLNHKVGTQTCCSNNNS